jgi:hypothetical protein
MRCTGAPARISPVIIFKWSKAIAPVTPNSAEQFIQTEAESLDILSPQWYTVGTHGYSRKVNGMKYMKFEPMPLDGDYKARWEECGQAQYTNTASFWSDADKRNLYGITIKVNEKGIVIASADPKWGFLVGCVFECLEPDVILALGTVHMPQE